MSVQKDDLIQLEDGSRAVIKTETSHGGDMFMKISCLILSGPQRGQTTSLPEKFKKIGKLLIQVHSTWNDNISY